MIIEEETMDIFSKIETDEVLKGFKRLKDSPILIPDKRTCLRFQVNFKSSLYISDFSNAYRMFCKTYNLSDDDIYFSISSKMMEKLRKSINLLPGNTFMNIEVRVDPEDKSENIAYVVTKPGIKVQKAEDKV